MVVAMIFGIKFDRFTVRRAAVGIGPGFLALVERVLVGQPLGSNQPLQCAQPMFVIMRAVIGFTTVGGSVQFACKLSRPLLPGKMTLFGKLDRKREGVRLPRLGEHRTTIVTRQSWQGRQTL